MATVMNGSYATYEVTFYDQDGAVINISTASTKEIWFKPPSNGTLLKKSGAFTDDGSDGKLQYADSPTPAITTTGRWRMQGYVIISSKKWYSEIVEFQMEDILA